MALLTAADIQDAITALREVAAAFRAATASIRTQPAVSDSYGGTQPRGPVSGWTQRLTAACRIKPAGNMPQAQELAARLGVLIIWRVEFAPGTDVRIGDGLIVDGVVYHVLAVLEKTYATRRIALCRRQEGDV